MRQIRTFILLSFLVTATVALANIYIPEAELLGESVNVRFRRGLAQVTGVFEFRGGVTSNPKILYLPIYGDSQSDATKVLANAKPLALVGRKSLGSFTPCDPPFTFVTSSQGARVFWFCLRLDEFRPADWKQTRPIHVRLEYSQRLVSGRFYYLPVIPAALPFDRRSWAHQMVVHGEKKAPRVSYEPWDTECLDNAVFVYLRNGHEVEVEP